MLPPSLLTIPDGETRILRNFEFLGAGIGDPTYLQAHIEGNVVAFAFALSVSGPACCSRNNLIT